MIGWIPLICIFISFGFMVWLINYYRQSYLRQIVISLQDLADTLLDVADRVDEVQEQLTDLINER